MYGNKSDSFNDTEWERKEPAQNDHEQTKQSKYETNYALSIIL